MTSILPEPLLRRRILDLRDQLQQDLQDVGDLAGIKTRRSEVESLLADLDRQLERVRRPPVITLVGATGAGKSTLLNALTGSQIAKEGEDRPTTRVPVVYAPKPADLGSLTKELPTQPKVVRYESGSQSDRWTEQILIDAPDVNSIAAEHLELVKALADRSDVLVAVLHRQSVVEKAAVSFLESFRGRRRILFVLNRADELTGEARAMLLQQIRWLATERLQVSKPQVVAISAKEAQTQTGVYGWRELCEALQGFVGNQNLDSVRTLNAVGTAAHLQQHFHHAKQLTEEQLTDLPGKTAHGLDALSEYVCADLKSRLELKRTDVGSLLWSETGKRWDGPCGWFLRSGGLSGLGLGAGAFLARRNPVIAAGAAGAAVATSKVRQAARKRRVAGGAETLLPSESDFEAWYGETLGEPRLHAAQLAGSPNAFGIPTAEQTQDRMEKVIEDGWTDLVDRNLPAAAERSVLKPVRWALDIPVYAFGAWVVWGAIKGFFVANYLGVDYLLNAAIILLVYLFVVRFFMRRYLLLRTRKLLASVLTDAKGKMAENTTRIREEVQSEMDQTEATLRRLSTLEKNWRTSLEEI